MKTLSNFISEAVGRFNNEPQKCFTLPEVKENEGEIKNALSKIKANSITLEELREFGGNCGLVANGGSFHAGPASKRVEELLNKMGVKDMTDILTLVKTFGYIYLNSTPLEMNGPFFVIAQECESIKA